MMPLFHIGGIARNCLAVALSGGSVVCCPGFDASLWWDIACQGDVTWYYAGPTMHQMIMQEGLARFNGNTSYDNHTVRLKMIANAAGGLLPALADQLKLTFRAAILPGYGMSECMPITAPPHDYQLDRPGTSGRPIGPKVRILDNDGQQVPDGTTGNICLRGCPLMHGYEGNEEANKENFFPGGWFNTGDLGHLEDDFIYISGRNKEVIKRGGETLSPFEIEEVFVKHPLFSQVMCFAAPHEMLVETVGLCVVMKNDDCRVSLASVLTYCKQELHPSKWPQCLVFMQDLPKTMGTNKVQRIKFATRTKMEPISDSQLQIDRTFEADCPPKGAPLSQEIPMKTVSVEYKETELLAETCPDVTQACFKRSKDEIIAYVTPPTVDASELITYLSSRAHHYTVPSKVVQVESIPRAADGTVDFKQLEADARANNQSAKPENQLESKLQSLWADVLDCEEADIATDVDFFDTGGNSLLAGKLASLVRTTFNVPFGVTAVFAHRTIADMAKLVGQNSKMAASKTPQRKSSVSVVTGKMKRASKFAANNEKVESGDAPAPANSSNICVLSVQALPMILYYPLRRIFGWSIFCTVWLYLMGFGVERFWALVSAILIMRIGCAIFFPLLGILAKWTIIGTYKPGRFRLWGSYYLRWWTVNQILKVCGRGMFLWHPSLLRRYYKLMGAKIGYNVKLSKGTKISEFDLVQIKDDVALDNCLVRPFCLDKGGMMLKHIQVGEGVRVCAKSTIAPGAYIPDDTCIGPLSSSYELEDAREENENYCRPLFPSPPFLLKLFLGYPLFLIIKAFSVMPVFFIIRIMVKADWYKGELEYLFDIVEWFATPERIGFYCATRIYLNCVAPFMYLLGVIIVKRAIVGKFTPGPATGVWKPFQYWMMNFLLPGGKLAGTTNLLGRHYETISFIYRCLGSKIGKRVYWPGSGVDVHEYDLFEVGDDVVFGSRSIVMCSDTQEFQPVRIKASANIADRCVLLPGVTVAECAVMGSGSLAGKNANFPKGSVNVGSQNGNALMLQPEDPTAEPTPSRFGKAFYLHQANYCVLNEAFHIGLCVLTKAFCALWRVVPLASCYFISYNTMPDENLAAEIDTEHAYLTLLLFAFFSVTFSVTCFLALSIDVMLKWCILGRRQAGECTWDESSYCQRWQIYLTVQEIRRHLAFGGLGVLNFIQGSQYLVWYFRALGCKIGDRVCLYPNGGDPMMTEPDLVTIEDGVCVDDASVVAHLNSKGVFQLQKLRLGRGAVLRSGSRLLSGAEMEANSCLLEHTLMLSGDVVPEKSVWQGWPGAMVSQDFDVETPGISQPLMMSVRHEEISNAKKGGTNASVRKSGASMKSSTSRPKSWGEDNKPAHTSCKRRLQALLCAFVFLCFCAGTAGIIYYFYTTLETGECNIDDCRYYLDFHSVVLGASRTGSLAYFRSEFAPKLSQGSVELEHVVIALPPDLNAATIANAPSFLCFIDAAREDNEADLKSTFVVMPVFLTKGLAAQVNRKPANTLVWSSSNSSAVGHDAESPPNSRYSSFDALDDLFGIFTDRALYPRLTSIVVVGNGAGGELAARHAMVTQNFPTRSLREQIEVRYIAGNAGSYVYAADTRPVGTSSKCRVKDVNATTASKVKFENVTTAWAATCQEGLDWPYQLAAADDTPPYVKNVLAQNSPQEILEQFADKQVFFLLSAVDSKERISSCGAKAQGVCPLQRGIYYQHYLKRAFQTSGVLSNHSTYVVKDVADNQCALVYSPIGGSVLFNLPVKARQNSTGGP
eukprot:CAMPEP_0175134990 /NCGR_PEP_ID=MMETSP0087-20121206/8473_1 /TAXON_ID=136419 /ORGANISM="Unknown Unknown, Strain D1" /LENGTH=1756 /DNA_ID=CAMNT_0016417589 /DNA_START=57 /DNA_END=5323 /DNA_ORIENTATION=-